MVGNILHFTMLFKMFSPPLWKRPNFVFCMSKCMSLYCPPFISSLDMLTSCYWLMTSTLWLMLSLPIPHEHIWFCVVASEGSFRFIVLIGFPALFLTNMLLISGGGFGTWFIPMPHSDPLWVLLFWLGLGLSLFVPSFPPLFQNRGLCLGAKR